MSAPSSETRAIALLALAAFVSASAFRICDPMLPQLAAEFDTTTGQAARAVTAFAVAYGVLQMFFGPLGDRYGKYRVVSVATLACALAAWLGLSPLAWAVLVLNIALVLAVEALNTALEFVVDLASPDYHQLAGAAKDTAAAAVLICATLSLAVGACLFVPPLLERFG